MARRTRAPRAQSRILEITALGAGGDGRADGRADGPIHVPLTLPGDQVRASVTGDRGEARQIITPSPHRVAAPCPHFGPCGGCALQHAAPDFYASWKAGLLLTALQRAGMGDVPVAPMRATPPATRRRATLSARRLASGVVLGFQGRRSHQIADLKTCLLLRPELVSLLAPLRGLLEKLLPPGGRCQIHLALLDTGVDLLLRDIADPGLDGRMALADFAAAHDLTRLSLDEGHGPEPVARHRPPLVKFGQYVVELPAGGFLQASREGEALLVAEVKAAVGARAKVLDLFSGVGTFALSLAPRATLHAVESDRAAVAALAATGQVSTECRDLMEEPLKGPELAPYDAIIFDPPRAGARAQAQALADCNAEVIVAVSCNPASFARDAAILAEGGWRLNRVAPIDQFPWSAHLELVGVFQRTDSTH